MRIGKRIMGDYGGFSNLNFYTRNGFPAAFLYSSNVDTDTCKKFFLTLREVSAVEKSRVFMTDDYPAYYNAWCEVFEVPDHRLLCSWHIIRNWTKYLVHVPDIEIRKKMKADLMNLQRELIEVQFKKKEEYFLKKYTSESCAKFLQYYRDHYMGRSPLWAYCYRKNLGINTNMYLENLHRKLKHIFMEGKKHRRMDQSITILMKLIYHMQYERIIRKTKGFISKRLSEIRKRHKKALECSFTVSASGENCWAVLSQSSTEMNLYTVLINPEIDCDCKLICDDCKICANQSSCDCFDYAIKGNLCKHIHYVMVNENLDCSHESIKTSDNEHTEALPSEILDQEEQVFFRMISNEKKETDLEIGKDKLIENSLN